VSNVLGLSHGTDYDLQFALAEQLELALIDSDREVIVSIASTVRAMHIAHPQLAFACGAAMVQTARVDLAVAYFHRAYLLGHSLGKSALANCFATALKPMRNLYTNIFIDIDRGESLRALNLLRMAASGEHRAQLGPVLAYCLRGSKCPKEGADLCRELLGDEPLQDDLYGHLFAFELELGEDQEAHSTALRHLELFPDSALAWKNSCDSALLLGQANAAANFLSGYLVFCENENLAFKKIFEWAEETGNTINFSAELLELSKELRRPDTKSLFLRTELLIELERATEAQQILEQILRYEPENVQVLLTLGRSLARQGEFRAAHKLLQSRQIIGHPRIPKQTQIESAMLLAAIERDLGEFDQAMNTWNSLGLSLEELLDSYHSAFAREYINTAKLCGSDPSTRDFLFQAKQLAMQYPELRAVL
jgi:tetratricopeptide (TPR) repeat protein